MMRLGVLKMFTNASLLYYSHAIDRLTVQRNQIIHEIEDRQERLREYNERIEILHRKLRHKQHRVEGGL